MAKYFLGSVGKAEAFRRESNGDLHLAFVSKTLTDSGLNISTTKDDIRAGEGAPVQFSFYHDSNVEITLTDVLWKPEYLEAQLGAQFTEGNEDYVTDSVTFANGTASYSKTIKKMPLPCGEEYVVWGAKKGSDDWHEIAYVPETSGGTTSGGTLTLSDEFSDKNGEFCIRYLGDVNNAKVAEITSMIIPEELFLIITAPIFAGDACAASKGKAAGHITFEIPRFQLNGAQEFAMNMSQNQTMSLAGVAMASESLDCDVNGGKLLRIIEVIDSRDWVKDINELVADDDSSVEGQIPSIWGVFKDGHITKLDNSKLTFPSNVLDNDGKWANAGEYEVKLTENEAIKVSISVRAAA